MTARRCAFEMTAASGRATAGRCRSTGLYRVWYRVDPETELTPDWRVYCRAHAERYAEILRGLRHILAAEVRPLDGPVSGSDISSSGALERPAIEENA